MNIRRLGSVSLTLVLLLFVLVPGVFANPALEDAVSRANLANYADTEAYADDTHVVQRGENLFRIALNHGVTTQELARANGIADVTKIYAGQVLTIPGRGSTSAPAQTAPAQTAAASTSGAGSTHVVQRGDTLSRIALNNGLTTQALAQANAISNPSHIYVGQVLKIPSRASVTSVSGNQGQVIEERWIDVNLTTQQLTAFEGAQPVYSALISSGIWKYPTVVGQFRIYLRYASQTMDGRRLGYDYYLPGVPFVMYFYKDYALHGTYWHNNFGTPMSHGCVNLTTADARWLYYWSDYGTLVNVHH